MFPKSSYSNFLISVLAFKTLLNFFGLFLAIFSQATISDQN